MVRASVRIKRTRACRSAALPMRRGATTGIAAQPVADDSGIQRSGHACGSRTRPIGDGVWSPSTLRMPSLYSPPAVPRGRRPLPRRRPAKRLPVGNADASGGVITGSVDPPIHTSCASRQTCTRAGAASDVCSWEALSTAFWPAGNRRRDAPPQQVGFVTARYGPVAERMTGIRNPHRNTPDAWSPWMESIGNLVPAPEDGGEGDEPCQRSERFGSM